LAVALRGGNGWIGRSPLNLSCAKDYAECVYEKGNSRSLRQIRAPIAGWVPEEIDPASSRCARKQCVTRRISKNSKSPRQFAHRREDVYAAAAARSSRDNDRLCLAAAKIDTNTSSHCGRHCAVSNSLTFIPLLTATDARRVCVLLFASTEPVTISSGSSLLASITTATGPLITKALQGVRGRGMDMTGCLEYKRLQVSHDCFGIGAYHVRTEASGRGEACRFTRLR
jgi:hypothetical protein